MSHGGKLPAAPAVVLALDALGAEIPHMSEMMPEYAPGLYCCISPNCEHSREQVFNGGSGLYDYPLTNSGPSCNAEESGYLDRTDVYCPFAGDGVCTSGCPTNRQRACILGE